MSKSKIVSMIALILFAIGIALVGAAMAGEKFKLRGCMVLAFRDSKASVIKQRQGSEFALPLYYRL